MPKSTSLVGGDDHVALLELMKDADSVELKLAVPELFARELAHST